MHENFIIMLSVAVWAQVFFGGMAPKKIVSKLTADVFEERYGCLVRAEFPELRTAHLLRKALAARTPAIDVTVAVLKVWFLRKGIKSRIFFLLFQAFLDPNT